MKQRIGGGDGVGIEALSVAVPKRHLALSDLAAARGIDPAKLTVGLGAHEMAVPDPGEDTVALAATAAAKLVREHEIDVARIGMIAVGTETGVDHSKAVASYVQGLLDLPRSMRTFDTQHACYGGTAALMSAADWVASGSANGLAALVICSDIARYGIGTKGEPTQGGGAVAMLVSDQPELLALDRRLNGFYSSDVHDFWRPLGHREALVDGQYSIECYLDAVAGAYRMWRDHAAERGIVRPEERLASEQLARIVYHVPFCKMAQKAHFQLRQCDLQDALRQRRDSEDPPIEDPNGFASFQRQVAPSLMLPARVGNTYTAALYFGLASLLHAEGKKLGGERIGLFSYGSGCSSEFYSGVVGRRAAEVIARAELDAVLAQRMRIDAAEYERIMRLSSESPPEDGAPPDGFRFTGYLSHRRMYRRGWPSGAV
jgi:hydroxymethylglutaryl-CoA synthase